MNNNRIELKYELILKHTVALHIEEAKPISSSHLIERFPNDIQFSSAKIRYLMNDLEVMGFLEKAHTSSGRIPTIKALEYYAKYLSINEEEQLLKRLKKVFRDKEISIENTVDQAASLIAEMTGLTLVTTSYSSDALLKSIDLVPLSENLATIILVVSTGEVFSKKITFKPNEISINDLKVAIRIFKERLIDLPLANLPERANMLSPILAEAVKNYQKVLEQFVNNVFNVSFKNNKVYGKNNIILSNQIKREDLTKLIDMIENQSIWEKIDKELGDSETIKISVDNVGSYMSKRINHKSVVTEISVVGAKGSDYNKMKSSIRALEKWLINYDKETNEDE
ncbi:heat-inducible transcriptional repressor HrcA [Mycoplasma buteonis]|uniref:heat-inducible transcriptional repressor HrcA n=1 Tax=Mycoplasma buteonis TaxID=171280 RepID=UPI00056C56B2|nr:heat-inducible transcriptional repressor HrcA [Mycoplasma buteonis]